MGRSEKTKKRYDRWSRFYDVFDLGGVNDQKKLAVNLLKPENNAKIMDMGTGTGAIIPYLAQQLGEEGQIIGIDFSENMVKAANERIRKQGIASKAKAMVADGTKLPFPDEYFDGIIATFAFTSFPEPEKAIRECARVLRPGGRFSILDTGKPAGKKHMFRYRYLKFLMWKAGYTDISLDIPDLVRKAGLKVNKIQRFSGSFAYVTIALKI
ncbi:MAG: methyltransferase domain-containing protein [Thermoplasmata archaeon]|nr:methyltransferase domain-containing protein [Thermoplasmata archaeon]